VRSAEGSMSRPGTDCGWLRCKVRQPLKHRRVDFSFNDSGRPLPATAPAPMSGSGWRLPLQLLGASGLAAIAIGSLFDLASW